MRGSLVFVVFCVLVGPGAVASSGESPLAADGDVAGAVEVAPDVYAVLHQDDRVRVLSMELAPGETDGLHRHPYEVVYFLAGGQLHVGVPGGEALDVDLPDGAVLSHEPWTHTVTNAGDSAVDAIIVELQQEPGWRNTVADGTDAVAVAPDYYEVLHEDGSARVLDMHLPPGAEDGEHTHPDEVVYFLSGGRARITTAEGAMELDIPDGHVLSHEGWTHSVTNVGDSPIHAIVWELK